MSRRSLDTLGTASPLPDATLVAYNVGMESAQAAFLASLPRGPKGQLTPGHTTWADLGPEARARWQRIVDAVNG